MSDLNASTLEDKKIELISCFVLELKCLRYFSCKQKLRKRNLNAKCIFCDLKKNAFCRFRIFLKSFSGICCPSIPRDIQSNMVSVVGSLIVIAWLSRKKFWLFLKTLFVCSVAHFSRTFFCTLRSFVFKPFGQVLS